MMALNALGKGIEGMGHEANKALTHAMFQLRIMPRPRLIRIVPQKQGRPKDRPKAKWIEHQFFPDGILISIPAWFVVFFGLSTVMSIFTIAGGGVETAFPAPGILGLTPRPGAAEGGRKTSLEKAFEGMLVDKDWWEG